MKSRKALKWMLLGVVAAGGLAAAFTLYGSVRQQDVLRIYGGADGLAIVANPDWVTASMIDAVSPVDSDWSYTKLRPLVSTSGPIRVSSSLASRLSATLISSRSYMWKGEKACVPSYNSRLIFYRGNQRVKVLFCFGCNELLVARNGRIVGGEDFDPSASVLSGTFKSLFPKAGFSELRL